jgi:menaquinol-cytochrome c reductase iron-sulfur subunit
MSFREIDRRTFHLSAIYGLWALITAALSAPAAIYLLFPPRPRKKPEWTEAGDLAKIRINSPEELVFRKTRIDGWKVTSEKTTAWVLRTSEKDVVAFSPQCPHLGCAYHWNDQNKEFLCPCHTSTFAPDGKVLTGPAPRPLDRLKVKVEGTKLLLGDLENPQAV